MKRRLFLGGCQTPLKRGLLRAVCVKQRLEGIVEYEINDTDVLGEISQIANISSTPLLTDIKGWFPVHWEYPFSNFKTRRLYFRHPKALVIGGPNLNWVEFREFIFNEQKKEIEWAASFQDIFSRKEQIEIEERVSLFLNWMGEEINQNPNINLSEFWLNLGKKILSNKLNEVNTVSFIDYWELNQETVSDQRFYLLDRFLNDEKAMDKYFQAMNFTRGGNPAEIPFFIVRKDKDNDLVREKFLLFQDRVVIGQDVLGISAPTGNSVNLLKVFEENGLTDLAVVPKLLPLIVQLRYSGYIYESDPPYLAKVNRFAELLGIEQNPIVKIEFDLCKILGRSIWRAFLREARRVLKRKYSLNQKVENFWQKHPTLIFLWILGGEEFINQTIETALISEPH